MGKSKESSKRSQKTTKCVAKIWDFFLFLPHFDVICDLCGKMHGNVESLCGIEQKDNNSNKKGILVKKPLSNFL